MSIQCTGVKEKTSGAASTVRDDLAHHRQELKPEERGLRSAVPGDPVLMQERDRILDVAEKHIRRIGHRKTTVDDIACDLDTSRANVYRFFPTRAAIDQDVYARIANRTLDIARAISRRRDASGIRLAAMFDEIHRQARTQLADEPYVHELFVAATEGKWGVAKWYFDEMTRIFEATVREGLQVGELEIDDAGDAARCAMAAIISFVHPSLLEQRISSDKDVEDELGAQTRFVLRALGIMSG
ncbi:TetR family transcriptional regulator [Rhizobium sp. R635]|nr:TetR family transcriptional regulator [Rhizobium sp. R635]